MGNNYTLTVKGNILTITVDLSKNQGQSKSGKSLLIASSNGNVSLPDPKSEIKLGLNIYQPI